MSIEYAPQFESIVSKARAEGKRMRVALAGADSESILKGLLRPRPTALSSRSSSATSSAFRR